MADIPQHRLPSHIGVYHRPRHPIPFFKAPPHGVTFHRGSFKVRRGWVRVHYSWASCCFFFCVKIKRFSGLCRHGGVGVQLGDGRKAICGYCLAHAFTEGYRKENKAKKGSTESHDEALSFFFSRGVHSEIWAICSKLTEPLQRQNDTWNRYEEKHKVSVLCFQTTCRNYISIIIISD